jgi:hypothetical protein
MNFFIKTLFVLSVLILPLIFLVYFIFGWFLALSVLFLFLFAIIFLIFNLDSILMYEHKAIVLSKNEIPAFYETLKRICIEMNLPLPLVFLCDHDFAYIFYLGKPYNQQKIFISRGFLRALNMEQMQKLIVQVLNESKINSRRYDGVLVVLSILFFKLFKTSKPWVRLFFDSKIDEEKKESILGFYLAVIYKFLNSFAKKFSNLSFKKLKKNFVQNVDAFASLHRYNEGRNCPVFMVSNQEFYYLIDFKRSKNVRA